LVRAVHCRNPSLWAQIPKNIPFFGLRKLKIDFFYGLDTSETALFIWVKTLKKDRYNGVF
jgi:hypothetical protein